MSDALKDAMDLRRQAVAAGYRPYAIECGPEAALALYGERWMAGSDTLLGMHARCRIEPGVAVLAMPNRKIGRFEVVCPTRFEARD